MNSTTGHADNVGTIPDAYMNTNSYQSHCMDLSKELMTFAIGGPRFFENNTLLENSPLWLGKNLAYDVLHIDTFRDCKFVYGAPLFCNHYEFPTNLSLKGEVINDPDGWWENEDR